MASTVDDDEWQLPKLRASIGFEDEIPCLSDDQDTEFFDVKFYPYADDSHDPIFAAVSKKHIVIYRLSNKLKPPYELVQLFRDDDKDALNCSCTWSKEPGTEVPWLCVAGRDSKIKVYDVVKGTLVKVLVGHGGEINDLATCPTDSLLIASASDDTTIRIWSLDPAWSNQPCVCLLAGEGHSSHLLTVAFHSSGRYVLSAGHDNVVCLWTLPDLPPNKSGENPPQPVVIHYPHFYTSEVHSGIVDCVAFFGDLILSRACHEDIIALWRIEGFSSRDPPPTVSEAPTTSDSERLTRSAFAPATGSSFLPQYTRLLQFSTPRCGHQFYLRFKLYQNRERHPVLAFGNAHSDIYFWDLARLLNYHDFVRDMSDPTRDALQPIQRPRWLLLKHKHKGDAVVKLKDAASDRDSEFSGRTCSADVETHLDMSADYGQETLDSWKSKYDLTRVEKPIEAHSSLNLAVKNFVGRQVAWSARGDWCVVVGSKSLAMILQRWNKQDSADTH